MKLKILKDEPKELRVEIEGEGHTFCNIIQEALLEEKTVDFAGYTIPHPLVSHPIVHVHVKGRTTARRGFHRALERLEKKIVLFEEEFEKSWEKSQK